MLNFYFFIFLVAKKFTNLLILSSSQHGDPMHPRDLGWCTSGWMFLILRSLSPKKILLQTLGLEGTLRLYELKKRLLLLAFKQYSEFKSGKNTQSDPRRGGLRTQRSNTPDVRSESEVVKLHWLYRKLIFLRGSNKCHLFVLDAWTFVC